MPQPDDAPAAKDPFDIDAVFRLLRRAVAPLPKAAMFELRDRGHGTPFEQLVAALISARTRDETTTPVCLRLFAVARTPAAMAALAEEALVGLLHGATFPEPKARDILALSRSIAAAGPGVRPGCPSPLTSLPPKIPSTSTRCSACCARRSRRCPRRRCSSCATAAMARPSSSSSPR